MGMKLLVIDGQGGKMGKSIVEALKKSGGDFELLAVGTNSAATEAMRKAGADRCATGENPVLVVARDADIIVGPMGIIAANSLLGEITPKMAMAVSESRAVKVLVPVNRCGILVAGTPELTLGEYIEAAVEAVLGLCKS